MQLREVSKIEIQKSNLRFESYLQPLLDNDVAILLELKLTSFQCMLIVSCLECLNKASIYPIFRNTPSQDQLQKSLDIVLDYLRKKNTLYITLYYSKKSMIDPLLQTCWTHRSIYMIRYFFITKEFEPSWLYREKKLASTYSIKSFELLSQKDWNIFPDLAYQQMIPFEHIPRKKDSRFLPKNSFILLKEGRIIGWSLTHLVDAETLRYSSLFILSKYRYSSPALALLKRCIKTHKSSSIKYALFEVNTQKSSTSWIHFCKQRLASLAYKEEHILEASCIL